MKENIENLTLPCDATLRDVLETLSKKTRSQIVFTVDGNRCVQGCITDGDIRRALLQGESMQSRADRIARKNFISVKAGTTSKKILNLMKTEGVRQVPILDDQGRLLDVKLLEDFISMQSETEFPVVIMAGGKGSRLAPFTDSTPKPLLKVGDRSIIERLILDFQTHGVRKFFISVNYLAEKIMEHLGDGNQLNCAIEYIRETQPLGTAGSLSLLKGKIDSDFLVINGDVLSTVDLKLLSAFHAEHKAVATVCAKVFNITIPYGVIKTNDLSNVQEIEEKPQVSFTINAGIYLLSPLVLDLIPENTAVDMPTLLSQLIASGKTVKCFQSMEPWIDVGSKGDFEKAEKFLEYLVR